MKLKSILPLAALTLLSAFAFGEQVEDKNRNALLVSPLTMLINSTKLEFPVISVAYERSLSETGYSLFFPLHGGYSEDDDEKEVVFGAGIGLRKYFGYAFKGSYITGQTDYIKSYSRTTYYGFFSGSGSSGTSEVKEDFLSTSQLSFGYKWGFKQVAVDLNIGGALYAQEVEKYTNFIASASIGFPFNEESFGF